MRGGYRYKILFGFFFMVIFKQVYISHVAKKSAERKEHKIESARFISKARKYVFKKAFEITTQIKITQFAVVSYVSKKNKQKKQAKTKKHHRHTDILTLINY